jgi:hypothetical protein
MICVSKADEASFKHLAWNQSPNPLAAHQTTREDLNGISNLREHVGAGQDTGGVAGGPMFAALGEKQEIDFEPPGATTQAATARFWSSGNSPPLFAALLAAAYPKLTISSSPQDQPRTLRRESAVKAVTVSP